MVDNLNGCCGLFVSVIIVIDLLQLTVGGYFLIIKLQIHFYRLVFIVEPCEDSLKQVRQTNALVCKLLCLDIGVWHKIQILANVTVYLVAVLQFKISED